MKILLLVLCLCGGHFATAQLISAGGAAGMGNTAVSRTDHWSIFNNAAAMSNLPEQVFLFTCENRFGTAGMNTVAAAYSRPARRNGAIGFSVSRFGDHLFNETNLSFAASHKINAVSLGVRSNYLQVSAQGAGTRGVFVFEFGTLIQLKKQLHFGAHLYNFTQSKISRTGQEYVPTRMKAGFSWRPISKLLLSAETEKDADFPARFKTGLEYKPVEHLAFRTGILTKPISATYGAGISFGCLLVDYSLRTCTPLLPAHQLALVYQFKKGKKQTGN